jgi:iron(III) transport system ATP-binding protein
MMPIRIQDVSKGYGAALAVERVTLTIEAGELFFLLGPSGCGKTTLLRILAGFIQPDTGEVYFGDQRVTEVPPRARDAGMVFQTYALWPHMTVAANVAYGLQVRRLRRQEIRQRVEQALTMVRLDGLGERKPNQLSGGQQQRVALARALVVEPRALLLDEPLSNLDARLRDEMREEIRRLHQETRLTMLYVTHDQQEALTLADRLAVMDKGKLVQVGRPLEVYTRPVNRFVAGFLGDSNFIPGTIRDVQGSNCVVDTKVGLLTTAAPQTGAAQGASVLCSIRPDALALASTDDMDNRIAVTVKQLTYLGQWLKLKLLGPADTQLEMVTLPRLAGGLRTGDRVEVCVAPEQILVLEDPD